MASLKMICSKWPGEARMVEILNELVSRCQSVPERRERYFLTVQSAAALPVSWLGTFAATIMVTVNRWVCAVSHFLIPQSPLIPSTQGYPGLAEQTVSAVSCVSSVSQLESDSRPVNTWTQWPCDTTLSVQHQHHQQQQQHIRYHGEILLIKKIFCKSLNCVAFKF